MGGRWKKSYQHDTSQYVIEIRRRSIFKDQNDGVVSGTSFGVFGGLYISGLLVTEMIRPSQGSKKESSDPSEIQCIYSLNLGVVFILYAIFRSS